MPHGANMLDPRPSSTARSTRKTGLRSGLHAENPMLAGPMLRGEGKPWVSWGRLDWRALRRRLQSAKPTDTVGHRVQNRDRGGRRPSRPSRLPEQASTGLATITAGTADEAMMTASGASSATTTAEQAGSDPATQTATATCRAKRGKA